MAMYCYVAYEATKLWCYIQRRAATAAIESYIFVAGCYSVLYNGGVAMRLSQLCELHIVTQQAEFFLMQGRRPSAILNLLTLTVSYHPVFAHAESSLTNITEDRE